MDGLRAPDGRRRCRRASSPSARIDDTRAMIEHATHDDHHRAVVIGGGLLGLEAARGLQHHGLDVTVVHSPKHLMNAQLEPEGGAILRQSMEALGIHVVCGNRATHVLGARPGPRPAAQGRGRDRVRPRRRRRRHPAQHRGRRGERADRGARHRRRRPDAGRRRGRHLRRRRVRAAPRRGLRPGRPAVGAGRRARRPDHRREPAARPTTAPGPRPSSRSPASTSPRWG